MSASGERAACLSKTKMMVLLLALMSIVSSAPVPSSDADATVAGNTAELVLDYYDNNEDRGIAVDFVTNPNYKPPTTTPADDNVVRRSFKRRRDLRHKLTATAPLASANTNNHHRRAHRLRHRSGAQSGGVRRFKLTVWGEFPEDRYADQLSRLELALGKLTHNAGAQ